MKQAAPKRTAWSRWKKLNWTSSPSRRLPHGLAGLLSTILGLKVISDSITGRVYQYEYYSSNDDHNDNGGYYYSRLLSSIPMPILAYALTALANAISGYKLAPIAFKETQFVFRTCAVFQMCMCYFIVRFLPHFTVAWHYLLDQILDVSKHDRLVRIVLDKTLWGADCMVTVILLYSTFNFWWDSLRISWDKSKEIAIAISGGTMGILLLSVYPVQLVLRGQDWYECVQTRYSHQASGMVGYIYVPATVTFSLILFGATLLQRGILSEPAFGISSAFIVLICLVGTVLSQEVHIPYISTQRIYLPCVEPEVGSTEHMVTQALDFSLYARSILTALFGIKFESEEL